MQTQTSPLSHCTPAGHSEELQASERQVKRDRDGQMDGWMDGWMGRLEEV